MNAFTNPVIVTTQGDSTPLVRIPLTAGSDGTFLEKWLQEILYTNPRCLPVAEIAPHVGELIPICMELETGAGPADILYVTAGGQLVLVETKLWRNPEARREVVAQILDYAKQLTGWAYEDLAREVARATGQGPDYLPTRVRQATPELNEASFVDGINRSLKTGDFLLLIVGDGIRTGVEALVGFIEQYGNLRFRFGLVEVAAYQLPPPHLGTLILPRILAKTKEIQRTVLMGPAGPIEFEQVATVEDTSIRNSSQAQWFQSFWSEYLNKLVLDDQTQPVQPPAKSTNQYFSMPPGMGSAWVSAFLAQGSGKAGVYLTFSKSFEKAADYYERLLAEREQIEASVGASLEWANDGGKFYISAPSFKIPDLNLPEPRHLVIDQLADMTNRFINTFRHRLDAYSREST
jgi:hypothetical protein